MINKLFVYGTLKAGRGNDRDFYAKKRKGVEKVSIKGSLYHLGGFPGLKLDDKNDVFGEIHTYDLKDFSSVLERTDRLEGCDPNNPISPRNFYNRKELVINDQQVFAYEYNCSVTGDQLIKDGEWK